MIKDVIKVCEIDWETDGEEVDLPDSVTIDVEELDAFDLETESQINEAICDHLSDVYGWLVTGYTRVEEKEKKMAYTMTHKEIAEALASKVAGTFDFETLLQTAYEVLKEDYEEHTKEELLEAIEEQKEYLGTTDVDDILKAAKDNVATMLYNESIAIEKE